MKKIVLGTVQFGTNYGINNSSGQVPMDEVVKILKIASEAGVKTLDTSSGYRESEMVLGQAMRKSATMKSLPTSVVRNYRLSRKNWMGYVKKARYWSLLIRKT